MGQKRDLERALRSFDADTFVGRHGGYKESLSRKSREYLLTCPCGSERLRWNVEKGTWICWGHPLTDPFGRTGDTIKLIGIMEGCDELESIGIVLDGYVGGDSNLAGLSGGLIEARKTEIRRLPPLVVPRGVEWLSEPIAPHERAWQYLANRGITSTQIRDYRIGYGRSGRLKNYIVFPVFMDRALVYYQGRATWDPPNQTKDGTKYWIKITGYRKTLNPPSIGKSATSGEVIFNYDRASVYELVVICEGPVDAIKVGPHAVALLGKVGQQVKAERLKRMAARTFVIYLDRGAEEYQYALALAKELSSHASVYIAVPPEGFDAGKLTTVQNAEIIRSAQWFDPSKL